jgi:hypothetical protein
VDGRLVAGGAGEARAQAAGDECGDQRVVLVGLGGERGGGGGGEGGDGRLLRRGGRRLLRRSRLLRHDLAQRLLRRRLVVLLLRREHAREVDLLGLGEDVVERRDLADLLRDDRLLRRRRGHDAAGELGELLGERAGGRVLADVERGARRARLHLELAAREEPADPAAQVLAAADDDGVGPELGADARQDLLEGRSHVGPGGGLLAHAVTTPIVSTLIPGAISL